MMQREYIAQKLRKAFNLLSSNKIDDKTLPEKDLQDLKEEILNYIKTNVTKNVGEERVLHDKQLKIALYVITELKMNQASIHALDLVQDFVFHPPYFDEQLSSTELLITFLLLESIT